jgi:predicted metal-dependent hydrolase
MAHPPIQIRNLDFDLPTDGPRYWHGGNPFITHFFNGLSIMFPEGEKFFMDAVRHYDKELADPVLRAEVKGFSGQEALHSREHRHYNERLAERGYPVAALERHARWIVDLDRKMPAAAQLALTCALEHFTAIMADTVLRQPETFRDAHPKYAEIWRWHALEEAEHKSVAFDVYRAVAPGWIGYLRRIAIMLSTTILFSLHVLAFQLILVAHDGKLSDFRSLRESFAYFWGRKGFLRTSLRAYASYYRPSFHPWEHDNSELITTLKQKYAVG